MSALISKLEWPTLESAVIVGMGPSIQQFTERTLAEGAWWKRLPNSILVGINAAAYAVRADLCFNIHDAKIMRNIFAEMDEPCPEAAGGVDPTWMRDGMFPVVCGEMVPEIPKCLVLDIPELIQFWRTTYFQTTFAYTMAWLMMKGAKKIWFYGADFNYGGVDSASEARKHCVKYWVGRGAQLGVEFIIPSTSALAMEPELYGLTLQPRVDGDFRVLGWYDPSEARSVSVQRDFDLEP